MSVTDSKAFENVFGEKSLNGSDKVSSDEEIQDVDSIKLDKYGFPLVPQPSQFKDDPLVSLTFPPSFFLAG